MLLCEKLKRYVEKYEKKNNLLIEETENVKEKNEKNTKLLVRK